jgi:hypothetical protein
LNEECPHHPILREWSHKGLSRVRDLWDNRTDSFKSTAEVARQTRNNTYTVLRTDLMEGIPWNVKSIQEDDWLAMDEPCPPYIQEYYHVA